MCIVFLWIGDASNKQDGAPFSFVLASNRDEVLGRPSVALHQWETKPGEPTIYAGKDVQAGGTWCGIADNGRYAVITNYRESDKTKGEFTSRGSLVYDFLATKVSEAEYAAQLRENSSKYQGFNLLFGDLSQGSTHYITNRFKHENKIQDEWKRHPVQVEEAVAEGRMPIGRGVYAVSNAILDTPWFKVERGKKKIDSIMKDIPKNSSFNEAKDRVAKSLIDNLLRDPLKQHKPVGGYPKTGFTEDQEEELSSIFLKPFDIGNAMDYGTRANTVILVDSQCSQAAIYEYGSYGGEWKTVEYNIKFNTSAVPTV